MSFQRFAPGTQTQRTPVPLGRGLRTRRVLASALALVVGVGSLVAGPAATPAAAAPVVAVTPLSQQAEAQILWMINADRARAGLPPLVAHGALLSQTDGWSTWMAAHGYLFHHPDLRTMATLAQPSGWSAVAENVGAGSNGMRLHDQFMASRSHASNVYGNFRSVGVGAVESGGRVWVTVRFLR